MAKRGHGHGHHGGAWKVAYADFVTAMMAFFLVMWILAQDKPVREAVAAYFRGEDKVPGQGSIPAPQFDPFRNPPDAQRSRELIERDELMRLKDRLQDQLAAANSAQPGDDVIRFQFLADGVRITAIDRSKNPIFKEGSSEVTEFGRWLLRSIAWEIERLPFAVEVEGHTQGVGSSEARSDAWILSTRRAESARSMLEQSGVKQEQFFRVAGYADRQPLNDSSPSAEENRRISILIRLQDKAQLEELRQKLDRRS